MNYFDIKRPIKCIKERILVEQNCKIVHRVPVEYIVLERPLLLRREPWAEQQKIIIGIENFLSVFSGSEKMSMDVICENTRLSEKKKKSRR